MSWNSLSGNQGVSLSNLKDAVANGIFVGRNTIPDDTRLVTKANANYYIKNLNLSNSGYSNKLSNQIVVKNDLTAATLINVSVFGKRNRNDGAVWKLFYAIDDPTMDSTTNMSMSSGSLSNGGSLLATIPIYTGHTLYFKVANIYYQFSPATNIQVGSYPTSGSNLNVQYSYQVLSSTIPGPLYIYANIDNTILFNNTPLIF
jgi:hypothetical protein